ncbi:MAG: O-antigen ligase family protein [Anaerolineae bacterium]|nr:O-antigen ligase family protein [Anaerolineae bacterium]
MERVADHELAILAPVALLLFFPNRWAPLVFSAIPLLWVIRRLARGRCSAATPLDGATLLLLLATGVGMAVAVDRTLSWARFWYVLLGLALYYGLVNGLPTRRRCIAMGDLIVVGGMGVALLALVGTDWSQVRLLDLEVYQIFPAWIRNPNWGGFVPTRGSQFNPRAISMGLAMLFPLALSQSLLGEGLKRRLLSALAVLLIGFVLLLTQSLGAIAGVIVAAFLLLTMVNRWFLLLIPLAVGLGALSAWRYGAEQLALVLLSTDHPLGIAVTLRLDMWSRALAMLRDMPYTGIGLDSFIPIQTQFYPGVLLGAEPHAHNLFLQVALDLGVPGLLAFLWLLSAFGVAVGRAAARSSDRGLRALLLGSGAGVAAYLGSGLIDVPWSTKSGLALWGLLGLGVAVSRLVDDRGSLFSRRWRWAPLLAVAGLTVLGLLLWPGLRLRNLALVEAHQALAAAGPDRAVDSAALERAASSLERALERRPESSQAYTSLGRLYGWLGRDAEALEAFRRGVELDGRAPLHRYAPWTLWRRELLGEAETDRWQDLVSVYAQWKTRYPGRAEHYVQLARVWERYLGDPARARAVLEAGLANDAQPEGVLRSYLDDLAIAKSFSPRMYTNYHE